VPCHRHCTPTDKQFLTCFALRDRLLTHKPGSEYVELKEKMYHISVELAIGVILSPTFVRSGTEQETDLGNVKTRYPTAE